MTFDVKNDPCRRPGHNGRAHRRLAMAAVVFWCGLHTPFAAAQTSRLNEVSYGRKVWSKVHRFLGTLRGHYISTNNLVATDLAEALSGPSNNDLLVEGGVILSGCRRHSCDEKGAILMGPDGKVEAVGIINFKCLYERIRKPTCSLSPGLSLFMPRSPFSDIYVRQMRGWARSQERSDIPYEVVWLSQGLRHDRGDHTRGAKSRE